MDLTNSFTILEEYGYNKEFVEVLQNSDVHQLFPNQVKSIKYGLFQGDSFLISTPSGSGKTLIAELAAIFQVSHHRRKCVFLFPLRALVNEKFHLFETRYSQFEIKCVKSTGRQEISVTELEKANLIFMTYEKFDACLRSFKHYRWISAISLITIDEIHILEKKIRGARLENLVIRLFNNLKEVQFIFLSATIGNPKNFYRWLKNLYAPHNVPPNLHKFHLIHDNTRPIPLQYYIQIVKNKRKSIQKILQSNLAKEGQILIFTNSRRDTRATCDDIIKSMGYFFPRQSVSVMLKFIKEHYPDESWNTLKQEQYLIHGLAYHHAGLESDEKKVIELLYINGFIRVLAATTTLSAGINTPSKIVILKHINVFEKIFSSVEGKSQKKPAFRKKIIECNEFHQICGRAGRAGFDEKGYAFVLAENVQEKYWLEDNYFRRDSTGKLVPKFQDLSSSISINQEILEEIILLKIYESISTNLFEIQDFIQKTYFFHNFNKSLPLSTIISLEPLDLLSMLKILGNDFSKAALENLNGKVVLINYNVQSKAKFRFQFSNLAPIPLLQKSSKLRTGNLDYFNIDFLMNFEIHLDLNQGVIIPDSKGWNGLKGDQPKIVGKYPFGEEKKIRFALFLILFGIQNSRLPSQDQQISLILSKKLLDLGHRVEHILDSLQILCFRALFPSTVMDRLMDYNVIELQLASNLWDVPQYKCTKLGEICIRSFILPKDIKSLYDFHENRKGVIKNISLSDILKFITPLIVEKIGIKLQYLADYLELWITEVELDLIIEEIRENEGQTFQSSDFLKLLEIIGHYMNASIEIVKFFYPEQDVVSLNHLTTRIKFGLKADRINALQTLSYDEILPNRKKIIMGTNTQLL
ncbi:MAG: DEAD/DEAH box helicase [Promethearchaeota archaeon]